MLASLIVLIDNLGCRCLYTEAYANVSTIVKYYCVEEESVTQPFGFELLTRIKKTSRAEDYRSVIQDWMDVIPDGKTTNWVVITKPCRMFINLIGQASQYLPK